MIDVEPYRISPGSVVELQDISTREKGGLSKKQGKKAVKKLSKRLVELQELLYAESKHSLLIIFQAMDAGGKDSTTRRVFWRLDPSGIKVKSFKAPTQREQRQDFLWRIHHHAPRSGHIAIFNRSQYEDVVAARVRGLQTSNVCQNRFEHINAFERLLVSEGTVVLKFFLHISKDYQKERLQRRLDRPDKHWKFAPSDVKDREHWDAFMQAYSEAIEHCSGSDTPWYVVPAERRWYRDLVVLQATVNALESLNMSYPKADFNPEDIEIV
ncbi:MAG: polyphosphate kinase 2 family protein [Alteromonadaceae bacterium]|nr:polyphosphate kinase 2 family protein [Alteromonadaceae bacterium]